jgi:hypothetical protein
LTGKRAELLADGAEVVPAAPPDDFAQRS